MGGRKRIIHTEPPAKRVYEELSLHDNFRFPRAPKVLTPINVTEYVVEAVARFLSPSPKVEGEDNDFQCQNVAAAVRGDLKSELLRRLRLAYQRQAKDYERVSRRIHKEMMRDPDSV